MPSSTTALISFLHVGPYLGSALVTEVPVECVRDARSICFRDQYVSFPETSSPARKCKNAFTAAEAAARKICACIKGSPQALGPKYSRIRSKTMYLDAEQS